jgi:SAM-dependent methyltransferase
MLRVYDVLHHDRIAETLGISVQELGMHVNLKKVPEFRYEVLTGANKERIMVEILALLEKDEMRVVGENNNEVWEKGWAETLNIVKSSPKFSMDLLAPKYFEKHKILRLNGEYIRTDSTDFLYYYDQVLRTAIFSQYLKPYNRIVEIGCGTGNSQVLLSKICSKKTELVASDWSRPSQELLGIIAKELDANIKPVNFNMLTLEGKEQLNIDNKTAVLTVHAMEQLGDNHKKFLEFLLKSSPDICVHLEPINEFYDKDNLFDYLAALYHKKRNYLNNWLTELHQLERNGTIKIIQQKRLGFGDRYHEAYNLVVWKPIKH